MRRQAGFATGVTLPLGTEADRLGTRWRHALPPGRREERRDLATRARKPA
jgi:hypothetical protein